ncbi:MAG: hypothetical protein DLM72_14475 [Candidatus Nitrosopolaris wilkensis]|nr:MAG: hypothetical protein DLM72_14475 [Candidatus Nitrosopolaris wilkensis]
MRFAIFLNENGFPEVDNVQSLETFYKVRGNEKDDIIYLEDECVGVFIRHLREKGLGSSQQRSHLSAIMKAYELNRVNLLRNKLYAIVGEDEDRDDPWGYNIHQIKTLMFNAKLITYKALIALFASAGPRRGGIFDTAIIRRGPRKGQHNYLMLKDLQVPTVGLDNRYRTTEEGTQETALEYIKRIDPQILEKPVYAITFYRGNKKYEYRTFCSHECYKLINQMLKERRDAEENNPNPNETLQEWMQRNPTTPVFRNRFNPTPYIYKDGRSGRTDPHEIKRREKCITPEPLTPRAIEKYIMNLRDKIGDDVKFTPVSEGHHRIPVLHGFRHFHKPIMSEGGINSSVSEWLQGRKLEASEAAYMRGAWPDYARLVEYWKVMDALTIDREDVERKRSAYKDKVIDKERKEREHAENVAYVVSEKQRIDKEDTDKQLRDQRDYMNKLMGVVADQQAFINKVQKILPYVPEDIKKILSLDNSSSLSLENKSVDVAEDVETEQDDGGGSSGA